MAGRPDATRNRKQIQDLTRQYEANVGLARSAARQKFAEGGEGAEAFAFQQPEGQQELRHGDPEGLAETKEVVYSEVQRPVMLAKGVGFYFSIFSCWDGYKQE